MRILYSIRYFASVSGLVKFWGNDSYLALVQSEDNCIKSVVPETIGYTGTDLEGKSPLIELGNIKTDWLDRLTTHGHLIRLEPAFQVT